VTTWEGQSCKIKETECKKGAFHIYLVTKFKNLLEAMEIFSLKIAKLYPNKI